MNILAADDEPLALEMLTDSIREALPNAQISSFTKASQLLSYAGEHPCDIAFLDINMRGITGIELAYKLKQSNPKVNIIFVTGYDEYATEAMAMHASGYVMKPVTAEKIQVELDELRHPVTPAASNHLIVKCFGNFEVYTPDGDMIHFERSRGKEVLAYLVYRAGASCTIKEIAAALFEDSEYDKAQRGYVQKLIASMVQALKKVDAEDVVIKNYNSIAVNVDLIDCDYYKFSKQDPDVINSYMGEFMAQYSWAEFATGYLEEVYWKNN